MESVPDKQQAHELIERLPKSQIATAVRFLDFMLLDPVARAAATAPPDEEPVTEADRLRFRNGQAFFAHRNSTGVQMEDVLADFGLKLEDFAPDPKDTQ